MTDKTVKVGDVVAWNEVPSHSMVRPTRPDYASTQYFYRERFHGWFVGGRHVGWDGCPTGTGPSWSAYRMFPEATIIALNLTGNETADELRALAEAFEREHPTT